MKKILIVLLSLLMILSMVSCKTDNNDNNDEKIVEEFNQLMKDWFIEDMSQDYLSAHFGIVDLEKYGLEDIEVTLGHVEQEEVTLYKERLEKLSSIDSIKLNEEQQVSYDTLVDYYSLQQELEDFEYDYSFLFTPNSGVNNNLITNFTEFEVRSEKDAKDFITLVNDTARYMDECIDYTLEQADEGVIQNDETINSIIEQCQRFISNREDNEVIKAFSDSIDKLNLTNADEYKKQVSDAVINVLIPAYEKVIEMYQGLLGKATNKDGLYYYENGKEYYAELFKWRTSSSKGVDKLEKELESEINTVVSKIVRLSYKLTDEDYELLDGEDYGYDDPYEMIDHLKSSMVQDFPEIPEVDYSIDYLDPSVTSDNVVAYYLIAPVDRLNQNVIKCNQSYCKDDPSYLCITLSHEGYPGHLYQHTYYFSNHASQLARYNLSYLGFTEGWAMYVEEYAYNYFGSSENVNKLNCYYNRLSYYLQAYCDILINYEGYQKDDVVNYLSTIYTEEYADLIADSLYSTLIADPAIFASYALGYYQMTELYDHTKSLLSDKFDTKEFNTVILDCGTTSFDVLEKYINKYIDSKNKSN